MAYEGFAEYSAKKMLEHAMGKTPWTMPTHVYVALFIGDPLGAGSELTDPSATDYARVETDGTDWGTATFSSPTATITNAADIDFGTAGAAWGTVTHCAIYDALTGGNMIAAGPLTTSMPIVITAPVKFPAGSLSVRHSQTTV
jgi:hypothetical protein